MENDDLEKALLRLKQKIQKDGVLKTLRLKRGFEKPSQKKKRKQRESQRRRRRNISRAEKRVNMK